MINPDSEKQIEEYLCQWITKLVNKKKYQLEHPPIEHDKHKPFHDAFLPSSISIPASFERSFSSGLGKTFENVARIIALNRFEISENQFVLQNDVPSETLNKIDAFIEQVNQDKMSTNYLDEVKKIVDFVKSDKSFKTTKKITIDLYIQDKKGNELFYEMKSPKPNKRQCLNAIQEHLIVHCMRQQIGPKVITHYAMAYNPNGEGNENTHGFSKRYLDNKNHVVMGKIFWDFLGGSGTYEELLTIYNKVGNTQGIEIIKKTFNV